MSQGVQNSSGLLLVDKPTGVTSHTVVAHVRKSLLRAFPQWDPRQRPGRKKIKGGPRPPRFKCGHAGTLDPLATGLLLILVGKASRLSPFLMGMDKSYLATVQFGEATDSLDSDGEVVASAAVPADPGIIVEQLSQFRGDILQVPPMISALKHEGQPLYKLVRQGKPLPELKARPVTISNFEVKDTRWSEAQMDFLVDCTSGTYIRSLGAMIAERLGVPGTLCSLRRLREGRFHIDNEKPLDPLDYLAVPPNRYFGDPEFIDLGKKLQKRFFERQENGLYLVETEKHFSILEFTDEKITYRLNRIEKFNRREK